MHNTLILYKAFSSLLFVFNSLCLSGCCWEGFEVGRFP